MGVSPIVQTEELTKVYENGPVEVRALNSVNLNVGPGEFTAIMGPSGSGKSTLLQLIGGLDYATSGRVFIQDLEITRLKDRELTFVRRAKIGFIFQFFNLLPTLTAEENVAVPLIIAGENVQARRERLDDLFSLIGMDDRRLHRPDQLSGGEQQRVAVARALVADPAVILADEPTGNLDRRHGREVLALLRRSVSEFGQTILMVTHDPSAAAHADRVVFLRDGGIVRELPLGGDHDKELIIAGLAELED